MLVTFRHIVEKLLKCFHSSLQAKIKTTTTGVSMQFIKRAHGDEQPYWPAGPFKIRLPFIHYRWELPEMIQGLFMFVVGLAMIPLLQNYLGMPYEAALAFTFIAGIGYILPALLGVPLVPGWITPAIPVVLLYLKGFEPGPEAIRALFALQIEVSYYFSNLRCYSARIKTS